MHRTVCVRDALQLSVGRVREGVRDPGDRVRSQVSVGVRDGVQCGVPELVPLRLPLLEGDGECPRDREGVPVRELEPGLGVHAAVAVGLRVSV